ncbi:uncharacterized protein LOC141858255 [Brevipalpus obovatus]|uniref:uncharacterized protein LOC141858255 n=1 Tax=Brevipalpus obovatus TaxID=246614 RepID=UPI003D9F18EE
MSITPKILIYCQLCLISSVIAAPIDESLGKMSSGAQAKTRLTRDDGILNPKKESIKQNLDRSGGSYFPGYFDPDYHGFLVKTKDDVSARSVNSDLVYLANDSAIINPPANNLNTLQSSNDYKGSDVKSELIRVFTQVG